MKSKLIVLVFVVLTLPSLCFTHTGSFLSFLLPSSREAAIAPDTWEDPYPIMPIEKGKTIAITIDDLPFVGEYRNFHLNKIITTLEAAQVPATGFIIAQEVRSDNWPVLQKFRDAGFGLGNHTLSHANLNKVKTRAFMHEIAQADRVLKPVLTKPKYFRYPYLAMGTGNKKNRILCYLSKRHYTIAPITIDSKDFAFNQRLMSVEELGRRDYLALLKPFYLDFIWQQTKRAETERNAKAQILLIHANLLNAYVLPDIIALYKRHGYSFVSLNEALKTIKEPGHCSPSMDISEPNDINMEQINKISI